MASFLVEGGHRLNGSITPQGAKNEALQVLCAVLLTKEKITNEEAIKYFFIYRGYSSNNGRRKDKLR